jgi:hypothetical protein
VALSRQAHARVSRRVVFGSVSGQVELGSGMAGGLAGLPKWVLGRLGVVTKPDGGAR